jgi:hypothetical protein
VVFVTTNSLRFEGSSLKVKSSSWRGGMTTLVEDVELPAVEVLCNADALKVVLTDGRTFTVPLARFPRLLGATPNKGQSGNESAEAPAYTGKRSTKTFWLRA